MVRKFFLFLKKTLITFHLEFHTELTCDRQIDGRMDRQMDRWREGETDKWTHFLISII